MVMELGTIKQAHPATWTHVQASVQQIRKFTGHASDLMCERYLEWGWNDKNEQEEMSELAMGLWE